MQISNYYLDNDQEQIVLDNSKYLLVVAGAGSGKTLTILGKIGYLLKNNINPNEILCISFTKKASCSLEEKILKEFNIKVPVYTFHKLGLEILKDAKFDIADASLLEDIINNFFYIDILSNQRLMKLVLKYFDSNSNYKKYLYSHSKEILLLSSTLTTFIRLFKCNNYCLNDYYSFFRKIKFTLSYKQYKREKIFLLLSLNIYLIYTNYLKENNEIDFDDMLIEATKYIKDNGYDKKLKYIIIDEYQDTSLIRFNLIKEIVLKTNASLMVVGDDFQSIYRFTGCDLDLFINFNKYFPNSKILKIKNTYRNSNELIKVAGDFVMKNPKQIKKNLTSNKRILKPIEIVYYNDLRIRINDLVTKLDDYIILGRNNNDIDLLPNDLKDKFLTVHKSKGLEWDNVIIINLENDILSFPSKLKNEKILRLVSVGNEYYPYNEERRLFYVALTRTKNKVYLLTPKNNPSIFVLELVNHYKRYISINDI